ncbi:MAG: CNNM domain-containing protein [Alphaproteobacteria bacterium]
MELMIWISGIGAIFLFLLASFLSATETSLGAFSRPRIHRLSQKGNAKAKIIEELSQKMNHVLGTVLIGNNATNTLATSLATSVFIQLFDEKGVILSSICLALFIIIFLEVLPKTYAINHPENFVLKIGSFLKVFIKILSPLMYLVQIISEKCLGLLGVKTDKGDGWSSSLEELRSVIDLHGKERLKKESSMLHSILDLASVTVEEIMVHRSDVEMIHLDASMDKVYEQIVASRYSRLPLWEKESENIVGVLHTKTFLKEYSKLKGRKKAVDLRKIVDRPWFVPGVTPLLHQMHAFRDQRTHLALVVDEYGSFSGIVTLEDILEEIVGQIDDEYDLENVHIRPAKNGCFWVDGIVTIRDFNRHFGLELPDEEAATIGGLLIYESQDIPKVGQTYLFYDVEFKILRREDNQITLVKIKFPAAQEG